MKLFYGVVRKIVVSFRRNALILFVLFMALVLILSACSSGVEQLQAVAVADELSIPQLSDVNDVEELKVLFNQDAGKPRIVLLLSPT